MTTLEAEYQRAIKAGIGEDFIAPARGGLTGVVGILRGSSPGPVVGFRFDIDSLEISESSDTPHRPAAEAFVSQHPGYAHMCGHDAHTAMGLLLALHFAENRGKIKGTVKFLFQPNEENLGGARAMVANGHLDDLSYLISLKAGKTPGAQAMEESGQAAGAGQAAGTAAGDQDFIKALQDNIYALEDKEKIVLEQTGGKTCITLPEVILFPSGSDVLTQKGIETLMGISKVLEEYPNRTISVEGHTDNVPIGAKIKNKFASNWELSTARAISVMNYMTEHFNLNRSLMAVKGYGPYKPLADNDSPEGRAQNRRVVIVVGSAAVPVTG